MYPALRVATASILADGEGDRHHRPAERAGIRGRVARDGPGENSTSPHRAPLGCPDVSTRVALTREYPYDVSAFVGALADPEFHRVKLDVDGSGRIEVLDFTHDADRVTVVLRQPVPSGRVPAAVERLLDGMLVIERTERWRLAETGCRGDARVDVARTPISAVGTMTVDPARDGARLGVDLDVTASVPLLGGGIERAVVSGIRALTGTEHQRIFAWLDAAAARRTDAEESD